MVEIRRSRLVVVEITYHNRGAYYEAGFAKGLGIPVYFIGREGFKSHNPANNSTGMRIHFDMPCLFQFYRHSDGERKIKGEIGQNTSTSPMYSYTNSGNQYCVEEYIESPIG